MKRIIIFCVALVLLIIHSSSVLAQDETIAKCSNLSLGYTLNNFHENFGYGLTLTSPYFLYDHVAIRLSVSQSFLNGIPEGKTEYEWMPYTVYKLGIVSASGVTNQSIRLYGEGGLVYIIPNDNFSAEEFVSGWYGIFGFEFFTNKDSSFCYFIELGGTGIGARAEKLPGKPLYANGFTTSVGLRVHL